MRAHRSAIILLTLLVALATVVGCSSAEDETVGPLPGEGETGQQILDGEALVAERCTVCHDLGRVDNASYDDVGWEATIDRMIVKGAELTEDEKLLVIEYLSNR